MSTDPSYTILPGMRYLVVTTFEILIPLDSPIIGKTPECVAIVLKKDDGLIQQLFKRIAADQGTLPHNGEVSIVDVDIVALFDILPDIDDSTIDDGGNLDNEDFNTDC